MPRCVADHEVYSPDNPSTDKFCAYHANVNYGNDTVNFFYTVEPYQDVPRCAIRGGANADPSGDDLIDSTAAKLAHEMFETITDPVFQTGWLNGISNEVGDICNRFLYNVPINGTFYALESVYSDNQHGCVSG